MKLTKLLKQHIETVNVLTWTPFKKDLQDINWNFATHSNDVNLCLEAWMLFYGCLIQPWTNTHQ